MVGEIVDVGIGHAADAPVGEDSGVDVLIEFDSVGVPVKHGPFDAAAVSFGADAREGVEEGFADAAAPHAGADVKVFEVDAAFSDEGGVVVEEKGKAGGFVFPIRR